MARKRSFANFAKKYMYRDGREWCKAWRKHGVDLPRSDTTCTLSALQDCSYENSVKCWCQWSITTGIEMCGRLVTCYNVDTNQKAKGIRWQQTSDESRCVVCLLLPQRPKSRGAPMPLMVETRDLGSRTRDREAARPMRPAGFRHLTTWHLQGVVLYCTTPGWKLMKVTGWP